MKTIRVSEEAHKKLTKMLGEKMAKTGKPQKYSDIIDDLVLLPRSQKEEKSK